MIEVSQLTRVYGATTAISSIDFRVEKGEVVGFLGPNGAGKSTTMRILAGSLAATSGKAMVGGFDVFQKPRDVKRILGYLPEVPPLYGDMTVRGFLRFCARIKGAPDATASVERVVDRVGLKDVAHRLVDHLSKGYRQRVGIASALVHAPPVLILDEPTSGLDPAQRVEIRELVRELAKGETTIVLSTHVLAEVEAVCNRVIVIHKGRIVASEKVDALAAGAGQVRLQVARPDDALLGRLRAIPAVTDVVVREPGHLVVHAGRDVREDVATAAAPAGLLELTGSRGLETAFLELTRSPS